MSDRPAPFDEPMEVHDVDGAIQISGPDGLQGSFTPAAAIESGTRLFEEAAKAMAASRPWGASSFSHGLPSPPGRGKLIAIEYDGRSFRGAWYVANGMVQVDSAYGSSSVGIGEMGASPRVLAEMVLRRIVGGGPRAA